MLIVKMGGSLFHNARLKNCLDKLVQLSQQESIIIVPGGGPFADQVRQAQHQHHFADHHAHYMAILAMAQFGLVLLGLCQEAEPFYYPAKQSRHNHANLAIWLPDKSLLEQPIMQNWNITSDSLALWLAQQLRPSKLTLLKHQPPLEFSIQHLTNQGILDKAFPMQYAQAAITTELFDINKIADYAIADPKHPLMS